MCPDGSSNCYGALIDLQYVGQTAADDVITGGCDSEGVDNKGGGTGNQESANKGVCYE